jgi:hypothetical protein
MTGCLQNYEFPGQSRHDKFQTKVCLGLGATQMSALWWNCSTHGFQTVGEMDIEERSSNNPQGKNANRETRCHAPVGNGTGIV